MPGENWKVHPTYSEYEVSDLGRVRRCVARGPSRAGRVLIPGKDKDGYGKLTLTHEGGLAYKRLHILVLETFIGPMPDGCWGLHWNDDKSDNRLENLRWGEYRLNHADWIRNGGSRDGSKHGMAKLTEEQVLQIRGWYIPHVITARELAEMYGVDKTCILSIVKRKTWTHI